MQNKRLQRFDLKKLLSSMKVDLESYRDRSIEQDDVLQDTLLQTLVFTNGDYTRDDFKTLLWHNFKLVKARLFDKRSGKVKYAATSLYDKDDNCVCEPMMESNNYEDREIIELVRTHCPVTYQLARGYTLREIGPQMGISFGGAGQISKKERVTIKKYL